MPPKPLSPFFLARVRQELRLHDYAPRTIEAYLSCLRAYLQWLGPTAPREAPDEAPRSYLVALLELGASRPVIDQNVSALKFVYIELYGWPEERLRVVRPRRSRRLPQVPTREQILAMASTTTNVKHRLAILFLYATGLRVSELVALDIGDVDTERLLVRVREGKGRKDRLTVLSARLVPAIRMLAGERSHLAPLFLGHGGARWSVRTVQHVVQTARVRAGLHFSVTPHSLRHAFATHLLEGGTSLRAIQGLLGHARVQTTVRYTRMTDPNRLRLASPL